MLQKIPVVSPVSSWVPCHLRMKGLGRRGNLMSSGLEIPFMRHEGFNETLESVANKKEKVDLTCYPR